MKIFINMMHWTLNRLWVRLKIAFLQFFLTYFQNLSWCLSAKARICGSWSHSSNTAFTRSLVNLEIVFSYWIAKYKFIWFFLIKYILWENFKYLYTILNFNFKTAKSIKFSIIKKGKFSWMSSIHHYLYLNSIWKESSATRWAWYQLLNMSFPYCTETVTQTLLFCKVKINHFSKIIFYIDKIH